MQRLQCLNLSPRFQSLNQPAAMQAYCSKRLLHSSCGQLPKTVGSQEGRIPTLHLQSGKAFLGASLLAVPATSSGSRATMSSRAFARELLNKLRFNRKNKGEGNARPRLTKGKVAPPLSVPANIPRPPYADSGVAPPFSEVPEVHNAEGIERMRAASKLAAKVLDYAGTLVKAGVTTHSIDVAVHQMIIDNGAYPSPLNYGGFPKSVCTSLNECICHGIPDTTRILDGDIINVDVTVYLDGYHGDTSRTFMVGNVTEKTKHLVEATKEALNRSIAICKPGVDFSEIGKAIHDHADKQNLGVVTAFVGHGIGKVFHAGPAVLHYRNSENNGKMQVGQTFTIEPMLSLGSTRERYWRDQWTAVTRDASWTAQFEHTLLITETGVEILTAYEGM